MYCGPFRGRHRTASHALDGPASIFRSTSRFDGAGYYGDSKAWKRNRSFIHLLLRLV